MSKVLRRKSLLFFSFLYFIQIDDDVFANAFGRAKLEKENEPKEYPQDFPCPHKINYALIMLLYSVFANRQDKL